MDKYELDALLGDFLLESREMLEAMGGEIVAWEKDTQDRQRLDTIFRFFHTMKGNCGLFDFPRLKNISHAAEEVLSDVRAGRRVADAILVSAILRALDIISAILDEIDANGVAPEGDDSALIAALAANSDTMIAAPVEMSQPISTTSQGLSAQGTVRLPVELLDRMMNGISDIALARNELGVQLRERDEFAQVGSPFDRLSSTIVEVSQLMTRSRMQPIAGLFATLPKLVRDISGQLGKQVALEIEGDDVELDREMVDTVRDPLLHIIRNAIDHGVEQAGDRILSGKPATGLLKISAHQSGNQILLHIADDGRGLNTDALVERAIAAGHLSASMASELSEQEKCRLVCLPGLSTAAQVSDLSGRGVGMDVVRTNIERIGGAIDFDSADGIGTRITLRIPLTLTITPILVVEYAGQQLAIPRSYVDEVVLAAADGSQFDRVGDGWLFKHRGQHLPCLSLDTLLGREADGGTPHPKLLILKPTGDELVALSVEQIGEHLDLAVKPVPPVIMGTGIYAGSALSDEGTPILLLDIAGLCRAGGLTLDRLDGIRNTGEAAPAEQEKAPVNLLLFRDFAGRKRGIRLSAVARIDEVDGEAVQRGASQTRVVVDGEILALAGYDHETASRSRLRLARLNDGHSVVAYALADICTIAPLEGSIVPELVPGEVEGVSLIDGELVEIIDLHWLFSNFGNAALSRERPLCRIPEGDPWIENFLRPIIEAAGYEVAAGDADVDVAIVLEEHDGTELGAAKIIKLDAYTGEGGQGAVGRYDRSGLLSALSHARAGEGR